MLLSILISSLAGGSALPAAHRAPCQPPPFDLQSPQTEPSTEGPTPPPELLTRHQQMEVVTALAQVVEGNYVYRERAAGLAQGLIEAARQRQTERVTPRELAGAMTQDLIRLSGDLHFNVTLDAPWVAQSRLPETPDSRRKAKEQERASGERTNFGFSDTRILPGNVGYIKFSHFSDPELASETLSACMAFVEHCDAFVLDLRDNDGGSMEMGQLVASFFLSSATDPVLFDCYYYDDGQRIERKHWVLPAVPGRRHPDAPLYILVSSVSFSAAEWFAYCFKGFGRAEIIGETTAGGAHPVGLMAIDDRFVVNVPIGEILCPTMEGDFEGVGVQPDHVLPSEKALYEAHRRALKALSSESAEALQRYEWLLPSIQAQLDPVTLTAAQIEAAVGHYDGRRIVAVDGHLSYTWGDKFRIALRPLTPTLFSLDGVADFRLRLIRAEGKTTALERVYFDGHTQRRMKTE